jgi:hypothetical protein
VVAISFVFIITSQKLLLKDEVKVDSVASSGSHGRYSKYVSFPCPPVVAAHHSERLAQELHNSGSYWL